ncbi:MAG: hypothetical protein ACKOLA_02440, partial [Spartobacteria bacterium]
ELAGNMTSAAIADRVADPYFSLGSSIAGNLTNKTFPKVDLVKDASVTIGRDSLAYNPYTTFRGSTPFAASISSNITSNSTTKWSTTNSTWSAWRTAPGRNWPATSLILPGEVTEIRGVADYSTINQYNGGGYRSIKENENRLSALFPGLTLQSNFFTIYAYAQALDTQGNIEGEALTKTLVEIEIETPATETNPAKYKVKKLYTQPIPLGQ